MSWKKTITEAEPAWKKTIEDAEPQGPLETAAETFADESLLGYYPQIAAGIKTLGGTDGNYAEQRDIERQELQRGQAENPVASGVGTVGSIAAQMAIPGAGAAKLATAAKAGKPIAKEAIKQILKYAALGTAVSAGKNPGDVQGEVTPFQVEERLDNAISEAPMNAISAVAGGLIDAKGAKKASEASVDMVKALRPTPTKAGILIKDDARRAKEVGEYIFKNKIAQVGDDPINILQKAEKAVSDAGRSLGDFIKNNSAKINAAKGVKSLPLGVDTVVDLHSLIESTLAKRGVSGASEVADKVIEQALEDINTLKKVNKISGATNSANLSESIESLTQMKRFMQDQVSSYDKLLDNTKGADSFSEGFDLASKFFSKKIDDEIAQYGTSELGKELKHLNKQYSLASDSRGLANRYAVRDFIKQDPLLPIIASTGAGAVTYAATKEPMLAAAATLGAGSASGLLKGVSPTSKAALANKIPSMLGQDIIPKASAYYSAQESTPVLPPTPQEMEHKARNDKSMTPTERARRINEIRRTPQ